MRHDDGGERGSRTNTAVVRTLGTWKASLRPTEWLVIRIKEGVLLLEAEPGNIVLCQLHGLGRIMTEVCLIGGAVAIVGGSENDNIVTTAERILVERGWTKKNIRVMAGGLAGGRTIEVPVGELVQVGDLLSDSLNGDNGFQNRETLTWTPGDVPCFYNEVRRGHQSKRLREKVKRKTVMEAENTYTQPGYWLPGRDDGKGQEGRGGNQMT